MSDARVIGTCNSCGEDVMSDTDHTCKVEACRREYARLAARLASAERERDEARADRDKAEENERVLADLLLSESVPTEDVHREIKARVDSGKIPPFIVCGWCGAPAGTMEAYKAHAVTCSENPAVQRAVAAEDSLSDLYATGDWLIGSWAEPCRVEFRAAMERARPVYDSIIARALRSPGDPG